MLRISAIFTPLDQVPELARLTKKVRNEAISACMLKCMASLNFFVILMVLAGASWLIFSIFGPLALFIFIVVPPAFFGGEGGTLFARAAIHFNRPFLAKYIEREYWRKQPGFHFWPRYVALWMPHERAVFLIVLGGLFTVFVTLWVSIINTVFGA